MLHQPNEGALYHPSTRQLVESVATIRSMDVSVLIRRGDREVTLSLRTMAKPDPDVALWLAHLGLRLPKASCLVENGAEKGGVDQRKPKQSPQNSPINCRTWASRRRCASTGHLRD